MARVATRRPETEMTDRIALVLALIIGCLIAADLIFGWGATLFLARKFIVFIDWIAFWR